MLGKNAREGAEDLLVPIVVGAGTTDPEEYVDFRLLRHRADA